MTRLILVPVGQTDWREHGRLAGDTDLPLNETGQRQILADAEAIAALKPSLLRSGPEQAARESVRILADRLDLKAKPVKELREMDLGHWEGLTLDDFRERFPRVYKQWQSDPTSVEPPEGESVMQAADRLTAGLEKLLTDHAGETVVVVLGHFAYAILRCRLQDASFESFWEYVEGNDRWRQIELPEPPPEKKASATGRRKFGKKVT